MNKKDWETYFDAVKRQDWKSATNALEKIARTEKDNPQVYLKQGDAHQKTGDVQHAIASYHRSAQLLRDRGFGQKAIALYKIILRLAPGDKDAASGVEEILREIEAEKKAPRTAGVRGPLERGGNEAASVTPSAGKPCEGTVRVPKLFSGMSDEEFTKTCGEFQVRTYDPGEKVIEEGDSGDSMYLIRSGNAKVVAHITGRRIELAELGEGDLFGEVAFLTGRPRTAEVIALGPLKVYEIGRLDIERIVEKNPEVLSRLEDFYEKRARDTVEKIRLRPKNT